MVSLALAFSLMCLARSFVKELARKETVERVAPAEEELPELWYSPYGEKTHYKRTFWEAAGKYLWLKVFMVVVLMSMSWFMVFEVNETYGYPLTASRMLNYKNKVLSLDNKNPEKKHVIKEITPAEVVPAGKSQEGDHTELFTLWSHLHEPNTEPRTRTRSTSRATSRRRTRTPSFTRTKEEESCNYSFHDGDVTEYNENLKNNEVPHLNYYKNLAFELVLEFQEYLAKAGRSLEPVVSYVVRTCHPVLLLLGTPLGMVTWIYLYFWVRVKQTKREQLKKKVSRRKLHRSVCSVLFRKRVWLHAVLLYSHMGSAVAMEEALQRLTDLTAQNTQQIQALAQAMNSQQTQAGTASQQLQELAQSVSLQQRAITEATQATNTALSQQAELTANAVAATGKLTADAVTALSQHAESRRPGEVDLHKMIKSPEVFGPTTYKEERDGFLEFRLKMRSWIGALNNDILEKINAEELFQESDLHQRIEVILDSGADVSLVPSWLGREGTPLKVRPASIQDAQGKAIKTEGRRMLNLTFFDDDGSFCRIQEAFTVASVINPLMAIGKLFREGWELRVNEVEGMCLTDGSSRIPVHLHKNSLAAYAYVQTPSRSKSYTSSNYKMVRTVVQLNKHIQAVNREEPGWHNTDSMVIVKRATQSSYENPSLMYSPTHFPYRSTLVKEERGWRAVEVSRKYSEKADPFEEFGEGEKEVVTAISAKPIPLWILGTPYAAGDRADQESHGRVSNCPVLLGDLENTRYTQGDCIYSTEIYEHSDDWRADRLPLREHFRLPWFGQTRFRVKPEVVEDLKAEAAAEELKKKKEEHYKEKEDSAAPAAEEENKDEEMREAQADQEAPQEVVEVLEESFYHEGVEYTAEKSSLKELQALCREYGVKTTGSKKQLLRRLATAVREERLNTQHKEQREHHQAYHLAPPQEPTEEERAYHNLTHLPYQPWCPHCVAMKAREDSHKKGLSKPSSSTDSAKPVISFDFCYTSTTGSEEPPAVTLVAVDSWSKAVLAVPCKRKGGAGSTTHLAEALVQFTTQLGYNTLVLKADNEIRRQVNTILDEERNQLENDEAASDPPSSEDSSEEQQAVEDREEQSESSSMSVTRDRKRRAEVDDDTLLEELQALEPLTASAEALAAPAEPRAEASKHSLEPEEPSSPSKSRKQVNRAEEADGYLNMPHDDEVYEADDEFLYESEEEEEEETEKEPTEVSTKVPIDFFDEEKGPPNVDPAFLQKLDDEATVKEIKRLTKMGVISLVSTDPQEATENVPLVDSEQELHKWLTTKLVKDWRFREATGFEVEEATAGITRLVPMLALANNWAIYSVDMKVNATHPAFGPTFVMDFWLKRRKKEVIEPILKNPKKKVNLQVEGPLLNEEDYEKGFSEEAVKFLKRKYTYEHHELRVHSDSKYVKKLVEILKLEKKKAKNSPCTPPSQEPDVSQELDEERSRTYRSCVGILLYVAHDRPDIQFAVRSLSTAMTKPTECKRKELEHLDLKNNHVNVCSKFLVNYDGDSFDEAKKEVKERAEKLEKEKEEFEEEKKKFEEEKKAATEEKTEFEDTVKRFLAKQKQVTEKEDKVTEREEKVEKDLETLQEQAKTLSEKETALEEAEEKVKGREAEVARKKKEVEKKERKAQERTTGYDEEREEYAKKYVDDAKKDLERELKVLKQEEKVRNQKLDDLQYDYKSLKDDYQYFKTYSQEVDALLLAAKDKIVKYKKKVKSLKETIGAVLSGSEGEEETEEAYNTKAEEEREKTEEEPKEEEDKPKEKRPKQVETEDQEEKPPSNQGDDTVTDPNVTEFTQLGYVWEFNKKTQEYRAKCEDKKGAARIKNAPVKGRMLWNKVTECFRKHNVWFCDGRELDRFLESKENEKIEEEVQRRLGNKGRQDNTGTKGKGPSWDDGQNDGWWYNDQWNNENWNTDDGSGWYDNANPQNKGYWQTPEEWAQQNQWEQWTPKGKSKGKKSKNWMKTQ
ncbi:GIP [Symbiodinium sp. CCMP2592]|nr:GIP [Symbiodinium sp. CCMP2592]